MCHILSLIGKSFVKGFPSKAWTPPQSKIDDCPQAWKRITWFVLLKFHKPFLDYVVFS